MARTCDLNDEFRKSITAIVIAEPYPGFYTYHKKQNKVLITNGVLDFCNNVGVTWDLLKTVEEYDDFDEDNDPYGEHDFGSFEWLGHKLFWNIDYYDENLEYGSEDPSNPELTTRVITILLASEY